MNRPTSLSRDRDGRRRWLSIAVLLIAGLTLPAQATDDLADSLYAATLTRERGLRAPGRYATLDELRTAIIGYEVITRQYPQSDLRDHSLWQGAGLAIEAYSLYRQPQDFETASRLLRLLRHQHPRSPLAARVSERLEQLDALTAVAWLNDISHETLPLGTRIIVSLDREVSFAAERLEDPSSLFFDFRETEAALPFRNTTLGFDDDQVISKIRLERHPKQITRVVLDLRTDSAAKCHSFTLYDPFRLVVDCQRQTAKPTADTKLIAGPYLISPQELGTPTGLFLAAPAIPEAEAITSRPLDAIPSSVPSTVPLTNSSGSFSVARQLGLGISRIVIDPGHGGHDSGTRRDGLTEADLVLDVALRLQQRLAATLPEIEVMLTRRSDIYVSLENRTAFANNAGADLFLSIHANASLNHAIRGVETYFLNFSTNLEVEAVAARENISGHATMRNLETLVEAIATNTKINESRDFAKAVQAAMVEHLQPIDPGLSNLGVKQAPFVVLIGARMPSVLSEIAFLTNTRDASLLASKTYRDHVADALLKGIVRYQESLGVQSRTTTVNSDL